MKLHLGCGKDIRDGWVNIDLNKFEGVDIACNVEKLPQEDNSVEHVLALEILEHISHTRTVQTLEEWHRVLEPGGTLELSVPDLDVVCKLFLSNDDGLKWEKWLLNIYGRHLYSGDEHRAGFNKPRLKELIEGAGEWESVEVTATGAYGRRILVKAIKKKK